MSVGVMIQMGEGPVTLQSLAAEYLEFLLKGRGYFSSGSTNGILIPWQMEFFTTAILQLLKWRVAGTAL